MEQSQALTPTSPLTEVAKDSLAVLFAKDPFQLTKLDITAICTELRAQRARWMIEEKAKPIKKEAKARKEKATALNEKDINDLLDLL